MTATFLLAPQAKAQQKIGLRERKNVVLKCKVPPPATASESSLSKQTLKRRRKVHFADAPVTAVIELPHANRKPLYYTRADYLRFRREAFGLPDPRANTAAAIFAVLTFIVMMNLPMWLMHVRQHGIVDGSDSFSHHGSVMKQLFMGSQDDASLWFPAATEV